MAERFIGGVKLSIPRLGGKPWTRIWAHELTESVTEVTLCECEFNRFCSYAPRRWR